MEIMLQRKFLFLGLGLLLSGTTAVFAQGTPAASRPADIQVGATYSSADSDYLDNRIRGFGFYGNIDVTEHWGLDLNFHQLSDPSTPDTKVYERSYEIGAKYAILHYRGRITPFVRADYGRGVFNFPQDAGNLAYNMGVVAAGADFSVHPRINVRVEYEYQDWFSGPGLSNGLTPTMVTFGIAYHLPAGVARR